MSDCYVEELKSAVDNNRLLKAGEIVVEFGVSESLSDAYSRVIIVGNLEPNTAKTLRILGDGYFTDSTFTQNYGKTLVGTPNVDIIAYVSNVATKVAIGYDYRLGTLQVGYDGTFDIDQLKFNQFKNAGQLRLLNPKGGSVGDISSINNMFSERAANNALIQIGNNTGIGGDISLFDFAHVANFRASGTSISGSVENIVAPNITEFRISNTKCTGSIENMLVSILNSGKIGSVTMNLAASGMLWNGQSSDIALQGDLRITFAANSITVAVGDITKGTYNGSSWSYA